ncbi:uncharacterized protein LOC123403213 [Hordeum vulgare subsp. vulgare]|uniref:Disease resistance protein At4g27190-like leucine-rich repeats domain-containing protein n=1 Tax=Hordeum vulgare subsp. vulgare TaxID=112509 RepID=M0V7L6_HORVV|nr:uncharacterized protein LOC123403213 [Hordeum vulgare subsp. vulgare]
MRTEVIKADTIDEAVNRLLVELRKDTTSSRENSIYFDGWDGLGASAVLQAIAKHLGVSNETSARPAGLQFEKIIHIDCSKWESRRAMQREIAEQLNLPNWVMDMFDKQDEDDDFNGLDQGSRTEIAQVVREIYQNTQNQRFLVILHNGGNEEIDIFNFGLSLYGYANSKMLWTFRGRFRLDPKITDNVKSTTTHVLLSASRSGRDPQELWSYLVRHEAAQLFCYKHNHIFIDSAVAAECVLYMLKQYCIGSHIIDYDWAIHTSNYWVCDGIIPFADIDKAWKVGDVVQHEVRLLNIDNGLCSDESTIVLSSHLTKLAERMPYCISTATCGFVQSRFSVILGNMSQHSHGLRVLKLSWCTFSFSSPPFLCCHSLRFLWLEHCQDDLTMIAANHHHTDADKKKDDLDNNNTARSCSCFQNLWVLDVRYTDCDQILSARVMDLMTQLRELNVMGAENWDMSHLQGRLRNIRKLRVTNSTCFFNNNVFSEMESMELLDFSGNHITQGMTSLSGPASLKTATIDGCDGLKNISFRGCKELANVILKGLSRGLEELDLSGTRVKILNLGGAKYVPKRIILLDSEKLRAILWPRSATESGPENCPKVVHIDTASPSTSAYGGEAPLAHPHADLSLHQQKEEIFKGGWQISFTDTRFLRLVSPVKESFLWVSSLHIDICTAATVGGSDIQETSDKLVQVQQHASTLMDSNYRDALKDGPVAAMMMWDCPKIYTRSVEYTCIIKMIMHGHGNKTLDDDQAASTTAILFPDFIGWRATSMHVYDNAYITNILEPSQGWRSLTWCRVERCPKLHTVFTVPQGSVYNNLAYIETFWASQLLSVRYIWDTTVEGLFFELKFLHLDHCPRLIHVLPLHQNYWWHPTRLETLEMVYCGDLREVFPLSPELQEQDKIIEFPELRRIHLHELPMMPRICGRRISAPKLKTIKVKGCWSLKRLPAVGRDTKPPKVDCEKEWWDKLEWDGLEKYHHPSLYEPSHSLYYKAQLPRGTVLR